MALVALFLGGGVAAGLGLGRALEPGGGLADAAPDEPGSFAGLAAFQEELAAVAERVSPSVVHITTQSGEQGDLFLSQGIGSGVVVSATGHIITNQHVV